MRSHIPIIDEKLDKILATIIRGGQFQSQREFVILIDETSDPEHYETSSEGWRTLHKL